MNTLVLVLAGIGAGALLLAYSALIAYLVLVFEDRSERRDARRFGGALALDDLLMPEGYVPPSASLNPPPPEGGDAPLDPTPRSAHDDPGGPQDRDPTPHVHNNPIPSESQPSMPSHPRPSPAVSTADTR